MSDWVYLMTELGAFDRTVPINKWTKPVWYEIFLHHITQLNNIKENKIKVKEEMFGKKAFLRST